MQYYAKSKKKHHFIITPDELRSVLKGFHHVVITTGVQKDYTESDPDVYFSGYDALYQKLKNGQKLIWQKDYNIALLSTGITAHLENCIYQSTNKLSVPDFLEPCPFIDTFCFLPYKNQLSTAFDVTQFPENICGLCLCFPLKIAYENNTDKHPSGIVDYKSLDDFETYETIVERIKSITKPLKLSFNGKICRTSIRISDAAKMDFENFFFIDSNNITIL